MIKYLTCNQSLLSRAIVLSKTTFKENMDHQFPLLFGEDNWHHMFLATHNDQVISMVNYYPSQVLIHNITLNVASIGSVATDKKYQGKGIASKLLQNAKQQMLEEDTDVIIISGEGPLYHRFGATLCGLSYGYPIFRSLFNKKSDLEWIEADWSRKAEWLEIYRNEAVRYERSEEEFLSLWKGQTYPDTFQHYDSLFLVENSKLVAYIILIVHNNKRSILVKEFGGSRAKIRKALPSLMKRYKGKYLAIVATPHDELNQVNRHHFKLKTHQHASFMILNPDKFFQKIQPWILENLPNQTPFSIQSKGEGYLISLENEIEYITDSHVLHQLVFGPNQKIIQRMKSRKIKNQMKKVFPIPFVWTNNLNYQ